jgi:integrase
MEQLPLRLLCRLDAPSVVPPDVIARIPDYRSAVRFCWANRRRTKMTMRILAEEAGLYAPHVTCYLADPKLQRKHQRDLPGSCIKAFESACGNTAISQWLAMQAQLTVLEAMQAQAQQLQRGAA